MRVIFSIILSLMLFFNTSFAKELSISFDINPNAFINAGNNGSNILSDIDKALSVGLVPILLLLYKIGDIIAIGILLYLGIKLLITTPVEKAKLKEAFIPYFVGLLFYIAGVPIAILIIEIIIDIF